MIFGDENGASPVRANNDGPSAGPAKIGSIKDVFGNLNRKFEEDNAQRSAAKLALPYFNLQGLQIDEDVLAIVPQERVLAASAVPFSKEGPAIKLGVIEPANPELALLIAELQKQKYRVEIYLVSRSSFAAAARQYKKTPAVPVGSKGEIQVAPVSQQLQQLKSLPESGERLGRVTASQLLDLLIGSAVVMKASDIHLEPEKNLLKVRFRVDGVLQDIVFLPQALEPIILSRIKLLSGLKLNVIAVPQDGRFTIRLPGKNLDVRVSSLPSAFGEAIVMRLLGTEDSNLKIEDMGLHGKALELIYKEIGKPNGMILTTGPTGSGKTTTLYAFLNYLNKPGTKIITIEDPVEYELEGIVQTAIDWLAGMDFAKALRSVLRQDPDILMVGEIRDFETAETVAQAALTGHMVFSTLHTNDAAGAIPRLLDLGVKPVSLAPAINALIAQRLVRRICPDCKQIYRPTDKELQNIKLSLASVPKSAGAWIPEHLTFYHSLGCAACHNLGYRGRIGVFEVFSVDEKIERLIYSQASSVDIKQAAVAQGMLTMQQDGILKALEGITDLAEVWRVTEE